MTRELTFTIFGGISQFLKSAIVKTPISVRLLFCIADDKEYLAFVLEREASGPIAL
jgi:hypothetical protein